MKMEDRKLKIAILGSQGIPAKFGGFETFTEQLATRLDLRNSLQHGWLKEVFL
jgi:hypothetical protein